MEKKSLFDFDFTQESELSQDSYKLIFFDTETTGSSADAQIIEIGAIVKDADGNFKLYDELCGTSRGKLIEVGAMVTHGIRNEDISELEPFDKSSFFKDLDSLNIASNYFIAHNLPFDRARLEYYGFEARAKLIDTLQCSKHLYEIGESLGEYEYTLENYKLQTFRYTLFTKDDEIKEAKRYGVKLDAHRAIGDVVVLEMFFNKLLERLDKSLNLEQKLEKLVELSLKPVMVKRFNFGKYKGKLLSDVLDIDRGYLEWLYKDIDKKAKSGERVDENMRATLKELVG